MASRESTRATAERYAQELGLTIIDELGYGVHGTVFSTDRQSAIKVFERESAYLRERSVYLRLKRKGVTSVLGFSVPELIDFNDALFVVEIGIVQPPFVLDFAGAYLDHPPEFSAEVLADDELQRKDEFGENWEIVKRLLRELRKLGIYMVDINPGNIRFPG